MGVTAGILNICHVHVVEQCSLCRRRGEAVSALSLDYDWLHESTMHKFKS